MVMPGNVRRLPTVRRVYGYQVTLCCWSLWRVGGQDVRDKTLGAPPMQEMQHARTTFVAMLGSSCMFARRQRKLFDITPNALGSANS